MSDRQNITAENFERIVAETIAELPDDIMDFRRRDLRAMRDLLVGFEKLKGTRTSRENALAIGRATWRLDAYMRRSGYDAAVKRWEAGP